MAVGPLQRPLPGMVVFAEHLTVALVRVAESAAAERAGELSGRPSGTGGNVTTGVVRVGDTVRRPVAPEVCQSVSGRVRGSPKRVITLALKPVIAVMWSPAVVMTRRQ